MEHHRLLLHHPTEDAADRAMPARLQMRVIGGPRIDTADVELTPLAVSAVNGCGTCLNAHDARLKTRGVSREAIHSAVRIASVVHAVAGVRARQAAAWPGGGWHGARRILGRCEARNAPRASSSSARPMAA
jgi:AhpD family alkylhydroperoxidase